MTIDEMLDRLKDAPVKHCCGCLGSSPVLAGVTDDGMRLMVFTKDGVRLLNYMRGKTLKTGVYRPGYWLNSARIIKEFGLNLPGFRHTAEPNFDELRLVEEIVAFVEKHNRLPTGELEVF